MSYTLPVRKQSLLFQYDPQVGYMLPVQRQSALPVRPSGEAILHRVTSHAGYTRRTDLLVSTHL